MNSNIKLASTRSSSAVTGFAANSTTVYHGPDSSNYATVGSIGPNETVNILAQSMGWYHVEYTVNGTTQRKTGYVPKSALTNVSSSNISEEDFYGGYCYATVELDVRTCDVFANTAAVGKLYKNEGCTFLFSYLVNGSNVAFIEYSTSSGTKRGYVFSDYLKFTCETIVAIAKEKIDVYAGPSTSYTSFGTIFQNELMSVIAREDNMIYVEYNTTKGRKRGYVDWRQVNPRDYNSSIVFNTFYPTPSNSNCHIGDERVIVYAGPSTSYAENGAVRAEDITCYWTNNENYALTCIEYTVSSTGLRKRGYVDWSKVIGGELPMENNALESFDNSYPYFGSKIHMTMSQLNQEIFYYKAGTGSKHIFLVFAQHGWEDGTKADGSLEHGDGNMLSKIAKNFMNRLASMSDSERTKILNNWTIFLFPRINPDGIKFGNTQNGFGRCFYNKIDPNRSWPGNFQAYSSPRNYTGSTYLGAPELESLEKVLRENISNTENILLDIHGWENSVIANELTLSNYFLSEFRKLNSDCKRKILNRSSGYLATWAENKKDMETTSKDKPGLGANAALLEFPATTDYSDTTVALYGQALFNATTNLLLSKSVDNPNTNNNISALLALSDLYDIAAAWNGSDNVLENNLLVLDFLRFEYSYGATIDFNSPLPNDIDDIKGNLFGIAFDVLTGSSSKIGFFRYVHSLGRSNLDPNQIKVYIKSISKYIDLKHFAVPVLANINNSNTYLRDFSGWAGDLISLASQLQIKYDADNSYNLNVAQISTLIGCIDEQAQALGFSDAETTTFELQDLYQDMDAVNLVDKIKTQPIHEVIYNYYENGGDSTRKDDFINNVTKNHSFSGLDGFRHIVRLYTNKQIPQAYFDLFSIAFGTFNSDIWGEKLANAFENRLLIVPDNSSSTPVVPTTPNLTYTAHCQNLGWQEEKRNGEMAGLYGQGLRIEAIIINADINIQYRVHMAGIGWGAWVPNGCMAGTTGESRAIEAIEIISSSNVMVGQGYVENIGYQSEVRGTQIMIGTTGQGLRLEGFRLSFV